MNTAIAQFLAFGLAAATLVSCNSGRSSDGQKIDIKPRTNAPGTTIQQGAGGAGAPGSGDATAKAGVPTTPDATPTSLPTGGTPPTDTSTSTSTDPLDFVGEWNGAADNLPPEYKWKAINVSLVATSASTIPSTPTIPTTTTPTTPVTPTTTPTGNPSSGVVSGNTVTFTIPAGTRANRKSWNDSTAPVNMRVGQTLIIVNGDSVSHTLHTNGAPFDHGSPIAAGGQVSMQIGSAFAGSPEELYEHDDTGGNGYTSIKFYIRTQ